MFSRCGYKGESIFYNLLIPRDNSKDVIEQALVLEAILIDSRDVTAKNSQSSTFYLLILKKPPNISRNCFVINFKLFHASV